VWTDLARILDRFPSAVLTASDAEGYPFSVRCHPSPDAATRSFQLELPGDLPLQPGPAGLLWHRHDDHLWNQLSYTTRGRLERADSGWRYTPTHYTPGLGLGGTLAFVRFLIGARGTTNRYLTRRGLPRPHVPWRAICAIKAEALGH
jgi:hypothetical protein